MLDSTFDFRDLRFNKIRHVPPECMSGLGALHTLLLNNNNVRRLRSGAFSGLVNLKYLWVNSVFDSDLIA